MRILDLSRGRAAKAGVTSGCAVVRFEQKPHDGWGHSVEFVARRWLHAPEVCGVVELWVVTGAALVECNEAVRSLRQGSCLDLKGLHGVVVEVTRAASSGSLSRIPETGAESPIRPDMAESCPFGWSVHDGSMFAGEVWGANPRCPNGRVYSRLHGCEAHHPNLEPYYLLGM